MSVASQSVRSGDLKGKRLLLLGGSSFALPVIETAHELGCHVVTMDYLPDNVAHRYSDEYVNVSVVEKDQVLEAARNLRIDGVLSFACDAGVVSAAYVAEKMGLSYQGSFEAVQTLQNKGRFRTFLRDNGFNCPQMYVFGSIGEANAAADEISYPVIVKPVDSAGSKGCSRVDDPNALSAAVKYALGFSKGGACIVEQFIDKAYPSSDSDSFTVDGRFECVSFTAQYFDDDATNPYTPAAYGMPGAMPKEATRQLAAELQRLSDLLGLRTGVYNIETRVGTDGLPYIMEISPRGGGNRLSEMLRYASGVDLIRACVLAAFGEQPEDVHQPIFDGCWYQEIIHSSQGGTYRGIEYAQGFKNAHVRDEQLWIEEGTRVEGFSAAHHAFGTAIMHFDTQEELDEYRANRDEFMRIVVE